VLETVALQRVRLLIGEGRELFQIVTLVKLCETMGVVGQIAALQYGFGGSVGRAFPPIKNFSDGIDAGHAGPIKKVAAPLIAAIFSCGNTAGLESTIGVAIAFVAIKIAVIIKYACK
jgi:hypothetical protein